MQGPSRRQTSVIAATILTLLTVTVFAVSRNQGPESAILRYHEALSKFQDPTALAKAFALPEADRPGTLDAVRFATVQNAQLPENQSFHTEILRLLKESRSVRIGHVQRAGRVALVDVVYASPFGVMTVRYAMQKGRSGWLIDTAETLRRTRSLMGLG